MRHQFQQAATSPAPNPAAPLVAPGTPEPQKLHRRFDRIGRLVGDAGMDRLLTAHVMVFGVGGVGSFAAETLVRSGVGHVTIVDFDLVCATNVNRQLHALQGTTGKPKVEVMAERLRRINPQGQVTAIQEFYNLDSSERLLGMEPDFVVDAIDNMTAKCHLIATCRDRGIPMVVCCGAAARMDPTAVKVVDLNRTMMDPMARSVRKILRDKHDFPGRRLTGIPAVYSEEVPMEPMDLRYDDGEGFRCVCPQGQNDVHSCEHRNRIDGSAAFVTGTFGLAASSVAVKTLLGKPVLSD